MRKWYFILLSGVIIFRTWVTVIFGQDFREKESGINYRFTLFHELTHSQLNDTPLNPKNELVPQITDDSYSSADIFFNWRFFTIDVKGDGVFSDLDSPNYKYIVREFYFDHSLGNYLHLTAGRKILKWGTGYAFNPTGVVEPTREASDPSDRLNRYRGRQIVAVDAYMGRSSVTFVYANNATYKKKFLWAEDELALRYYTLWGDLDLSVVGYWREGERGKLGFNTAYTYGTHLELHTEIVAQIGTKKLYHGVLYSSDYQINFRNDPYTARYQNSRRVFPKLLIGGQYTFDSGINVMGEYYYNREGLTQTEWNKWRKFTLFHRNRIIGGSQSQLSLQNFLNALYTLSSTGTMRHYGFFRVYVPFQKSGLDVISFFNLLDGSGILIPTYRFYFSSSISVWIRASYFSGEKDSEFGVLFTKDIVNLGLRVSL